MSKLLKNPLFLCLLILVGLYLLSGVIDAGKILNTLPFLGWLFWGLLCLTVFLLIVVPVLEFLRLPVWRDPQSITDDTEKSKLLKRYAKHLLKRFPKEKCLQEICEEMEQVRIQQGYVNPDMTVIEHNIIQIRRTLTDNILRKVIHDSMTQAAVLVMISPKGWMDSVILLLLQVRLIKNLSGVLGYRPTGTFVFCCCLWCISNSFVASLFDELNLGENAAELFAQVGGEKLFSALPGISWVTGNIMQGIYAVTAVYSTGIITQEYLMGTGKHKTLKELVHLRLEGIKESKSLLQEIF